MPEFQGLPFSTERIVRIVSHIQHGEYKRDPEKIILNTCISGNEGLNIINEYGIILKKCIRENCCEEIIKNVTSFLSLNNLSTSGNMDALCFFDDFLEGALSKEEKELFLSQIDKTSKHFVCDSDKKHILFQLGYEFGYRA